MWGEYAGQAFFPQPKVTTLEESKNNYIVAELWVSRICSQLKSMVTARSEI
jgi:hypothetical protein